MFERGVVVSHQTIRQWCAMFGRSYANELRLRRPRPGNKWYLDEVFTSNQRRAEVFVARGRSGRPDSDAIVQSGRNATAAKRFFRKVLKGLRYVPTVLVTAKLASYKAEEAAAKKGEPEPSVADADRIADLVNAGEPIGKGCPIGKEHEPDCPNCCPGPTWHGSTVPEGLAATPTAIEIRPP